MPQTHVAQRPFVLQPAPSWAAEDRSSILTDVISINPLDSDDQDATEVEDYRSSFEKPHVLPADKTSKQEEHPMEEGATRCADDLLEQVGVLRETAQAAKCRRLRFRGDPELHGQRIDATTNAERSAEGLPSSSNGPADNSDRRSWLSFHFNDEPNENPSTSYDDHNQLEEERERYLAFLSAASSHDRMPDLYTLDTVRTRKKKGNVSAGIKKLFKRLLCFAPSSVTRAQRLQLPSFPPAHFDTNRLRVESLVPVINIAPGLGKKRAVPGSPRTPDVPI
ncbi:hypothetical protein DFH11DRAFT_1784046 [Phellopilus nigrolimitatus]|nr:hypothetical protein DFH11DRAFT_1784046 [Phellopilus nigrolimitatus]